MQKNDTPKQVEETKKKFSDKDFVMVSIGLILIALLIVAGVGKTVVGEFLAYCLAYLFGLFYPFVLALLLILALRLILSRRLWSMKGRGLFFSGAILLTCSLLAFGSFRIYASREGGVPFSDLAVVYNERFQSFARYPFHIDSFDALGGLGGGFLGIFLITLFGSIWQTTGDAIFFSLLLAISLVMILFKPIRSMILMIQENRKKKVRYHSPYQPNKEGTNPHLDRKINGDPLAEEEETIPEELKTPYDTAWAGGTLSSAFTSTDTSASTTKSAPRHQAPIAPEEEEENSAFTPAPKNPSPLSDEVIHPQEEASAEETNTQTNSAFSSTTAPAFEKSPSTSAFEETKASESEEEKPAFTPSAPAFPPAPTPVVKEEAQPSAPLRQPQPQVLPQENTNVNPLEQVAANSKPIASKNESHEIAVDVPAKPVSKPVAPVAPLAPVEKASEEEEMEETPEDEEELSEEDIENRKAAAYFADIQKAKIAKIQEKKKEHDEKLASLMRFVSDTPKSYGYALPDDSLLAEVDDSAKMEKNTDSAQEKAKIINKVFDEFDVHAKATSFTIGASVTRFNVETEHGEKADKIASLTSEFQRALNGDMSVRVETVVEGRSTSGIEVGNTAPMAVSFKDVFSSIEQNTKDSLLLPIGKDISGNIVSFPLNKMPHLLVAGTTGSGKSVLIHSMIMTLIMRNYPSQLKLILIDPKQVEFIRYQECSHLFCPVISKPESAILALKKLCGEMDRRFSILSKYKTANLEDYNALRKGREKEMEQMPYLVCIIDEFADLMQTGGAEVERNVTRLAQKARACGIHLIIATQRPSKDNVPMIIKANVPSRIGLSVSSQIDSRVILDENGAETLLGRGDLLFKCPGKKTLIRAQSPFVSNEDINNVLAYIKKNAGDPVYDPDFLDLDEAAAPEEEEEDVSGDLYDDIKDFVKKTGITSKSCMMRSFQISSQKADQFFARLVQDNIIILGPEGKYVVTHWEE